MLLVVPSDPLRPRRPDEHFAGEAAAARELGIDIVLVDHDALARGGMVDPRVPGPGEAVYRGWMLRSEHYAALAAGLRRRDVTPRTSADHYRRAHELPGWYATLAPVTPRSAWTQGTERDEFERVRLALGPGPAVLRDYSKSMKHYWHEATFIPDLADAEAAWRVASRFLELRAEDLVGGFVLRRFEDFVGAEVRSWWADGRCVLIGPHPDTPDDQPPADLDLAGLTGPIGALGLPFLTADLARRADGRWRVVEVGDGQVSDRPKTIDPAAFVAACLGES